MKQLLPVFLLISFVTYAQTELPLVVRCGSLINVERTKNAQKIVNMNQALLLKKYKATEEVSIKNLKPEKGKVFLIMTFKVNEQRSIGMYDYKVSYNDNKYECLGLNLTGEAFDPRQWEVTSAIDQVQLLYQIPANANTVQLIPELKTSINEAPVTLDLGK